MEEIRSSSQKMIRHALEDNLAKELKENAEIDREKARMNSVGMKYSGAWLQAVPVKSLGLHLRPLEFVTAVKYRLGMRVYSTEGPCRSCTTGFNDAFGDHAVGCASDGERIFRHNVVRDALYCTAKSALLSPAKEENSLLPGSAEKPADVFIPGWHQGRDAAFDVSIVSPLQTQLVRRSAEETGSSANKRYADKMAKYFGPCDNEGIQFFPLIVETLGGWHPDSVDTITKLARQLACHAGTSMDDTVQHLFQRLGILLARGNSALILHRRLRSIDAEVDGDIDH